MFDAVYVINMNNRPERLDKFREQFPADWPWMLPERYPAVDGSTATIPEWFRAGPGAFGCMQSHLWLWAKQVCDDNGSVLILEDDAVLCRNAVRIIQETMECVPDDWDQIYFGGQHLRTAANETPPEVAIQDKLIRCHYVNRTHAYAIRLPFADVAYDAIDCPAPTDDGRYHHVDYRLGALHESGKYNIYAPWRFCIGQESGESDVKSNKRGRRQHVRQHWWNQFPIAEPAGVV